MEGVHLALRSQLGTEQKGALIEGVHLWRVHLQRVDCTTMLHKNNVLHINNMYSSHFHTCLKYYINTHIVC